MAEKTYGDVYKELNDEQKEWLHICVGVTLDTGKSPVNSEEYGKLMALDIDDIEVFVLGLINMAIDDYENKNRTEVSGDV